MTYFPFTIKKKKKKAYFIPDSQSVIAKELSFIKTFQFYAALQSSDETPHYYFFSFFF